MMRKLKIIAMLCLFTLGFTSCEEDSDSLTGNKNTGGLISVENKLVGYVVGDGLDKKYPVEISVFQSVEKVATVNIYKTFYTVQQEVIGGVAQVDKDGKPIMVAVKSNEVIFKTLTFPMTAQHEKASFTATFNELRTGLTVDYYTPRPISSADTDLNIGDYWAFRYETITASGKTSQTSLKANSTKVAVGTRFAGSYKAISAKYYRIGVLTYNAAQWPKETVIESVDATTYKVKTYLGPAAFTDNEWYFKVDSNDNITYPAFQPDGVTPNLGNAFPIVTCGAGGYADWNTLVNCGNTNTIVRDDANGKDILKMTFGYINPTSGLRSFYQELQKI
jgi:hypothetical protein